jgi:hypothetical protein
MFHEAAVPIVETGVEMFPKKYLKFKKSGCPPGFFQKLKIDK